MKCRYGMATTQIDASAECQIQSTNTSAPGNLLEQIFKPIYIQHVTHLQQAIGTLQLPLVQDAGAQSASTLNLHWHHRIVPFCRMKSIIIVCTENHTSHNIW